MLRKYQPVRKIIYGFILLVGLSTGYFLYDFSVARQMTVDACRLAIPGMLKEDFLSKFSAEDYKIIKNDEYILIVPKRGLGRNHCAVFHDGRTISGAKAGWVD